MINLIEELLTASGYAKFIDLIDNNCFAMQHGNGHTISQIYIDEIVEILRIEFFRGDSCKTTFLIFFQPNEGQKKVRFWTYKGQFSQRGRSSWVLDGYDDDLTDVVDNSDFQSHFISDDGELHLLCIDDNDIVGDIYADIINGANIKLQSQMKPGTIVKG